MHLTKVFHFCREIVCYGKKDLHLETNQTRLESGLHRLLLDDLGQIIHFFFFFEPEFLLVEIFWGGFSVQPHHFWMIDSPIFTYLM